MKPASRQERLRFVANAHHDLTVMGERHMKDLEQDFMSLIQEFEDKITRLKLTLPKEFLQIRMDELHSLGNSFPEVVDVWKGIGRKNLMKEFKSSLRGKRKIRNIKEVTFSSPTTKTPKTLKLKLGKRNSLGRVNKYMVMVEGNDNLDALIRQGSIRSKNIVRIPDSCRNLNSYITETPKQSTGPITRSRRIKSTCELFDSNIRNTTLRYPYYKNSIVCICVCVCVCFQNSGKRP
ncbi:hypothetical protein LOD99_6691 [Oopsacas minuta]|uniref:Borealin N-terminal domain-containing protein n=1 Tax=Oopsacas minuta TaxID=111878 RepID=A0AAV7JM98_9METZ|nr:hypothetical protein LOD99_6691 [Oopsacas minuta]